MEMPAHDSYRAIGLMSGSSLDGVDLAYCHFSFTDGRWHFSVEKTACIEYSQEWLFKLRSARGLDGRSLWRLHADYGHLLGGMVADFVEANDLKGKVDLIASHGHTIFHFPDQRFTAQIGDGAAIAAVTGMPVVSDLRSSDVALGGSGAPIVPIGDRLLFPQYAYLLNLGGIANITIKAGDSITAFDICPANQVLNHYAQQLGHQFDVNGHLAASGQINAELLSALNTLDYYQRSAPKSLDNGYTTDHILPAVEKYSISIQDKLATATEHIAVQIGLHISRASVAAGPHVKMLVTGGGAFNTYLINRISHHANVIVEVPSAQIVSYKEAIVMALIGVLRLRGEVNVLSSVTGASRDARCGAIYLP